MQGSVSRKPVKAQKTAFSRFSHWANSPLPKPLFGDQRAGGLRDTGQIPCSTLNVNQTTEKQQRPGVDHLDLQDASEKLRGISPRWHVEHGDQITPSAAADLAAAVGVRSAHLFNQHFHCAPEHGAVYTLADLTLDGQ